MTSANVRSSSRGSGALALVAAPAGGMLGSAANANGEPISRAIVRASELRRDKCGMLSELLRIKGDGLIPECDTIVQGRLGVPADE